MKKKSHRHRAEVIEIYESGAKAAVKFSSGRIECVLKTGMGPAFKCGQKGMVDFLASNRGGYEWFFMANKGEK